jgi:hypothetical protein
MSAFPRRLVVTVAIVCGLASAARAQEPPPTQAPPAAPAASPLPQQQISANPFGLLLGLFNAEFERKVSDSTTLGLGGSFFESDGDDYVNGDVFFRFYPSGRPLEGWAFGVKAGATSVDSETYFGFGFDANWSWLLGRNDNVYVGVGFGLKRLFGTRDDYIEFIPTVRIINIGIAF